ncbi:hypothetical protein V1517DRAFT_295041 [Lipomyces orientalis]|uniref:Uncharacterized protein n=1 Tax=Lipomyces orientalis TaxID=1233043 RepID=A0ACC3TI43_9ASCO
MASEESLEFSTESFLESVLSELDKLGTSNPTPDMPPTASITLDLSIPASGQSNEHVDANQEDRRNSEADDFELIDLIESHMTEYGGTVDSASPTLEAGSPLNGSMFESISPLNESFRCLTVSGEEIYAEQRQRLENSEPHIVVGPEDGILSYTEDGTATGQEIGQRNKEPADDVEQVVQTQAITSDVTGIVEALDEDQTAQQPPAETVDAEDAVRDTVQMEDDARSNVLHSESAGCALEPPVEADTLRGDAAEMNDEVLTADLTASVAAETAPDDVVPIDAAADPVQESDIPVAEPEVVISTLDAREDLHDRDDVRNSQNDSCSAVVVEDAADEEMANGAPMTMAKDPATLIEIEPPAGSGFTIQCEESSTEEKQSGLQAALVPELVTTGERWKGVGDETVLENETAKSVVEVVAEPAAAPESTNVSAEPDALAEPATESSDDLKELKDPLLSEAPVKDIELKDPVLAEALVQEPESTIPEQPTESTLAPAASAVDEDSKVYIYTSFTGGGMFGRNIMTATNRLQLILKSNGIAFELVDLATNEQAKKLWARSSRGKKLPGVVKGKDIVGNYEDIEEANEFGEVQQLIAEFV